MLIRCCPFSLSALTPFVPCSASIGPIFRHYAVVWAHRQDGRSPSVQLDKCSHAALAGHNERKLRDDVAVAQLGITNREYYHFRPRYEPMHASPFTMLALTKLSLHFGDWAADRIVWFSTKMFIIIYFMLLARKWPTLMIEWERIEQNLPRFIGRKRNFAFFNQIKFHTILITVSLFSK